KLLTLVAQRVADGRVLRLIRAMLKAGSYGKGQLFPTERGTPQGGVMTPLTQKVTSSLSVGSGIDENRVRIDGCRIWFMFMTDAARQRCSQGSAPQSCSRAAAAGQGTFTGRHRVGARVFDLPSASPSLHT